ncbi:MAG: RNA-binding protein [Thermodesulfovibrionia bacterium]|nr:RNA-binding protein [Thermodesulfovibrionia bacterium]
MGKKIYVGGIPFQATEEELKEVFLAVAEVESVKIIQDLQTGRSRGFGFIEMVSDEGAEKAIADLNGSSFMGKTITVNEARPQRPREKKGYGRGGGGYGRGGGGNSFGGNRGPGGPRGGRR